jgi:hypothetical protein
MNFVKQKKFKKQKNDFFKSPCGVMMHDNNDMFLSICEVVMIFFVNELALSSINNLEFFVKFIKYLQATLLALGFHPLTLLAGVYTHHTCLPLVLVSQPPSQCKYCYSPL